MPTPVTPLLATDCVLFDDDGKVLLVTRANPPFAGHFALPGGFVDIGETVEAACRRVLKEETGAGAGELALLGIYSDPDRDPRGHVCSVVFVGHSTTQGVSGGDDAAEAEWISDWRKCQLAFDHRTILEDAERFLFAKGRAAD